MDTTGLRTKRTNIPDMFYSQRALLQCSCFPRYFSYRVTVSIYRYRAIQTSIDGVGGGGFTYEYIAKAIALSLAVYYTVHNGILITNL
jgi:hypothetical protein